MSIEFFSMIKTFLKKIFLLIGIDIKSWLKMNRKKLYWPQQTPEPQTFYDLDKEFHDLYDLAQLSTEMTISDNALRRQRHYALNYLLKCAPIECGDVAEVGCWKGLSAYQIADYLSRGNGNVAFHIFDSFEGLSEFEEKDLPAFGNPNMSELRRQFSCSQEKVKSNLSKYNFIKFYKGWVPQRFSEVEDLMFSFVHVDVDLYKPIIETLRFFYPRMVKNGIVVLDDYGCNQFPGAKVATDEFMKSIERPFFVPLPSGQAFIMKI